MGIKYSWKKGSRNSVPAQIFGEVLESLPEVTAAALVDASRPESAPTHKMFDWDNESAAEKYRQHQARVYISAICVEYETAKEPQRAYFNIYEGDAEYRAIAAIKDSEEDTQALLGLALRELRTFKNKYAILKKELADVFAAIDAAS